MVHCLIFKDLPDLDKTSFLTFSQQVNKFIIHFSFRLPVYSGVVRKVEFIPYFILFVLIFGSPVYCYLHWDIIACMPLYLRSQRVSLVPDTNSRNYTHLAE